MPVEDLGPLIWLMNAELAELFGVPVEQVWAGRLDLGARSAGHGRPR
jgi:hypothetical protein